MKNEKRKTAKKTPQKFSIKSLFKQDENPKKGLLLLEKIVLGYIALTLLFVFFAYTKLPNPGAMISGRMHVVAMTAALWLVYRLVPCRITMFVRIVPQLCLLGWWYPDTYEINRILPNLDHVFASVEQALFGCQPALEFVKAFPSHVFSELMMLGYASYYPMIILVVAAFFFCKYDEFERVATIVLGSFFAYYLLFELLPVAGPTFYYCAIGLDSANEGVFPAVGHWFNAHQECLPTAGWDGGFFYSLVEAAKAAGERPTAAFPSSHVGIATVLLLLSLRLPSQKLFFFLLPFYVLLSFSTVYIQAHYAIDAFAGLLTGVGLYYLFISLTRSISRS